MILTFLEHLFNYIMFQALNIYIQLPDNIWILICNSKSNLLYFPVCLSSRKICHSYQPTFGNGQVQDIPHSKVSYTSTDISLKMMKIIIISHEDSLSFHNFVVSIIDVEQRMLNNDKIMSKIGILIRMGQKGDIALDLPQYDYLNCKLRFAFSPCFVV